MRLADVRSAAAQARVANGPTRTSELARARKATLALHDKKFAREARAMPFTNKVGSGPALVFHHGRFLSGESWVELGYVDALKEDHQFILLDARGRGDSDEPYDPVAYDVGLRAVGRIGGAPRFIWSRFVILEEQLGRAGAVAAVCTLLALDCLRLPRRSARPTSQMGTPARVSRPKHRESNS